MPELASNRTSPGGVRFFIGVFAFRWCNLVPKSRPKSRRLGRCSLHGRHTEIPTAQEMPVAREHIEIPAAQEMPVARMAYWNPVSSGTFILPPIAQVSRHFCPASRDFCPVFRHFCPGDGGFRYPGDGEFRYTSYTWRGRAPERRGFWHVAGARGRTSGNLSFPRRACILGKVNKVQAGKEVRKGQ